METLSSNDYKELMSATKCLTEGIFRLYALGHDKEADALTALVNIARFDIEDNKNYTREQLDNDYVLYCKNLHNYSNSIMEKLSTL